MTYYQEKTEAFSHTEDWTTAIRWRRNQAFPVRWWLYEPLPELKKTVFLQHDRSQLNGGGIKDIAGKNITQAPEGNLGGLDHLKGEKKQFS